MNETPITREEIENFIVSLGAKINAHDREEFPHCPANHRIVQAQWGKKNVRVVTKREGAAGYDHASAYCFVDIATGDILKPAGWKAPAKHARGNIRVGDASNWWNGALGEYGAAYLR